MKLTILKSNLKDGLSAVERSIGDHVGLAILKNVLIKTNGNKINLLTTNLEMAVTKVVSGKITEEGSLTVPFGAFYGIVNNTNQERVELETISNNLIFKTDNYEAKIQGLKDDDFPVIPQIENKEGIEFNPVVLKDAISKVVDAAQISEIRPEISGVLIDYQINKIKFVATDSFRLAEKTLSENQFKSDIKSGFKAIVPLKTIYEVLKIFNNNDTIEVCFDENQVSFKNKDVEMVSRLIAGNYPDYDQIIPKKIDIELNVNKDHFINAVRLVSTFSGKNNDINLASKDGKVMEVYLANQLLGENNYAVPAMVNGGDFKGVAFNWRYLIDGLKAVGSNNLVFGVNGSNRPAIIKSADDASHFYILMPIKS